MEAMKIFSSLRCEGRVPIRTGVGREEVMKNASKMRIRVSVNRMVRGRRKRRRREREMRAMGERL